MPSDFNAIVARAMAKDPWNRYQRGKDFALALHQFRAHLEEQKALQDLGSMVSAAENMPTLRLENLAQLLPGAEPEATLVPPPEFALAEASDPGPAAMPSEGATTRLDLSAEREALARPRESGSAISERATERVSPTPPPLAPSGVATTMMTPSEVTRALVLPDAAAPGAEGESSPRPGRRPTLPPPGRSPESTNPEAMASSGRNRASRGDRDADAPTRASSEPLEYLPPLPPPLPLPPRVTDRAAPPPLPPGQSPALAKAREYSKC